LAEGAEEADHGLRLVARLNYEKGVNDCVPGKWIGLQMLFRETGLKSQGGDSAQDAESDQEDEPICGKRVGGHGDSID